MLPALACVVVLGMPGLLHAAEGAQASPCNPAGKLPAMLDALPLCQSAPLFLAALGLTLNSQARYQEAAEHLERALMLDPSLKDAQLQYAISLVGSGDPASAQALLANLLQEPGLSPSLRQAIEQQSAILQAPQKASTSASAAHGQALPAPGWQRRITLGTRLGFDSNLLGAPNLDSLVLTFSGQTLELPLDETYQATAGSYVKMDAQMDLRHEASGGGHWDIAAALRSRASPAVPKAGATQIDIMIERNFLPANGNTLLGSYIGAQATQLYPSSGSSYLAWGFAAGWQGAWRRTDQSGCMVRAGLDAQDRKYGDAPVLSGRYTGVSATESCQSSTGVEWVFGLKSGQDIAQSMARPGGDQRQTSARMSVFVPALKLPSVLADVARPKVAGLLFAFDHGIQQDSSSYSAYLDSGRTRTMVRQAARTELQLPVSRAAQWVFGLEWVSQTSNLVLFQQQGWGASGGYRHSW